ncbi:MAG TPA: hypothetical protein VG367_09515 [Mucilaginibacter sp.]|jgi:hypothetical protein|nr:hypothetical protein [Mucilaginibacter sp.]
MPPLKVINAIRSLKCPKHHEQPKVTLTENQELRLETCCPDFKKQCLYLVKKLAVKV